MQLLPDDEREKSGKLGNPGRQFQIEFSQSGYILGLSLTRSGCAFDMHCHFRVAKQFHS